MEKSWQEVVESLEGFEQARKEYSARLNELLEKEVGNVIYLRIDGIDCGGYDAYRATIPGELKKNPDGNFQLSTIHFSGDVVSHAGFYRNRLMICLLYQALDELEKSGGLRGFPIECWGSGEE